MKPRPRRVRAGRSVQETDMYLAAPGGLFTGSFQIDEQAGKTRPRTGPYVLDHGRSTHRRFPVSHRFPLYLVITLAAAAAALLKGPRQPLRPSSPQDGVGPLIRRRYWVELTGSGRPAGEVARHWRTHLADHAPKGLIWFRGLDHPIPPVGQGDRLWLRIFLIRRGRVVVEHVGPLGFRVRTLRLHPEAGTTDFRVFPGATPGDLTLQIESLLRSNSTFDLLAYVLGVHAAQRLSWQRMLESVARYAGGRVVSQGTETLETPALRHSVHLPGQPEQP